MEKIVPHGNLYKIFSRCKTISSVLLIFTTLLSIGIAVIDNFYSDLNLNSILIPINSLLIISYVIIEIVCYYIFSGAEVNKRLDNLDNAFGTNYSGKKSKGYFSNDNIETGIYKLGVNCFENCFFTYNISKHMLGRVIAYNVILALIFFMTWLFGEKESAWVLVQLILPVVLIQDLIKLMTFVTRNEKILKNFHEMFSDSRADIKANLLTKIIRNILDYETNITWAVIQLNSKTYEKQNESLSKEWEQIKTQHEIK